MATQHVKRNRLLNLYREENISLVCFFLPLKRDKDIWHLQPLSLVRRPLAFLPVTLLLPHNCTHFTCQQSNAQNSPNQASTVHELRTSRCSGGIQKRQRNQRSNCQYSLEIIEKAREFQKNIDFIEYAKVFVWIITNCGKFLKRWEYQTTLPAS